MPDRHDPAELPPTAELPHVEPPPPGEPLPPPAVDIADETYVRADPAVVASVVADTASWIRWWPDLVPHVTRDRGVKGQQWAVTGALHGSMEVWLEAVQGGTVVHWYLRADPREPLSARRVRRTHRRRVLAWKQHMFELKDRLESFKERGGPAD